MLFDADGFGCVVDESGVNAPMMVEDMLDMTVVVSPCKELLNVLQQGKGRRVQWSLTDRWRKFKEISVDIHLKRSLKYSLTCGAYEVAFPRHGC